jgi:Tol biopolymer transport system component
MKNVIVALLLLIGSACANVCSAQPPLQKFQQPQEQASPASQPEKPPQSEQPRQSQQAHRDEPPPPDAVFYREISWSPDNSRIAFSAMQDGKWNIYVMHADGSQATKLTSNTPDIDYFSASWSPDGKQIAFSARHGKNAKGDIYVMNANGSGMRQLTLHRGHDSAPAWSPDGRRIAFISDRDSQNPADNGHEVQIYVMRADGSGQTRLTNSATHDYDPQWSPDSKRLVYYAEKGDRKDQVWVVNADGSNPTLLTGGVGHNIFPSWSPDGKSIIFTSHRDGPEDDMTIYTMKPDGSDLKQVSEQQAFYARFTRDGTRISFLTGKYPRNAIYVMNADGLGLKKLTP